MSLRSHAVVQERLLTPMLVKFLLPSARSSALAEQRLKFKSNSELLMFIRCEIGKRLDILTRLEVRTARGMHTLR